MSTVKQKSKKFGRVASGLACISATFNNIMVNITDPSGNTLVARSAGRLGYKGAKKSTPLAAQDVATTAARLARDDYGMKTVEVNIIGPGAGRESAIKGLCAAGLIVTLITDKTPTPHNGCRPRKRRRV